MTSGWWLCLRLSSFQPPATPHPTSNTAYHPAVHAFCPSALTLRTKTLLHSRRQTCTYHLSNPILHHYTTSVSYSSTFISCLHITQPCTPALRTNEPPGLPNSTGIGYFWALFLMRNLYTPQFISCCTLVCTCSRKLDAVHAGKRSPPRTRCLDYTWQACHLGFDSNG